MKTWQDFYTELEFECNKGTLFNHLFPSKVFQALRQLEQNWTYRWMEKLATVEIDPLADNPRIITLPAGLKSIKSIRLGGKLLHEISPEDFDITAKGEPTGYFRQGDRYLWLNSFPSGGDTLTLVYDKFTLEGEIQPETTHPVLEHGWSALLAGTMQQLAPTAREPSWVELYGPLVTQGIHTLHVWDEESRMADHEVIFGGGEG